MGVDYGYPVQDLSQWAWALKGVLCVLYFEVSTTTNSLGLMIWVLHIVYGNLIQGWPLDYCLLQWVQKISTLMTTQPFGTLESVVLHTNSGQTAWLKNNPEKKEVWELKNKPSWVQWWSTRHVLRAKLKKTQN